LKDANLRESPKWSPTKHLAPPVCCLTSDAQSAREPNRDPQGRFRHEHILPGAPDGYASPRWDNRYRCSAVHELLEALVNIGIYVLLFGLLAWALYFAFGPHAFGLPAIVGVLVVLAGLRIFSNVGVAGLAVAIVGPGVLVMVIGMAMTIGTKKSDRPNDGRPVDKP
jgi:hypothetical protein